MPLEILNQNNAPEGSQELLKQVAGKYGFTPNMVGLMANSPSLLKAYLTLGQLYDQTSLTPAERQVVLLAASQTNGCHYCRAAHTVIAGMQGVPGEAIEGARDGKTIPDAKLEALRRFVAELTETRGKPSDETKQALLDAGYSEAQILEIVLGVGMKTLSNYTNILNGTPIDAQFQPQTASAEAR